MKSATGRSFYVVRTRNNCIYSYVSLQMEDLQYYSATPSRNS